MRHILFETGRIASLADLYDDLQDAGVQNVEEYMRLITVQPGLKLNGDDFLPVLNGSQIEIPLGSCIFPNYVPFVAPADNDRLMMEIPSQGTSIPIADMFIVLKQTYSYSYWVKKHPIEEEDGSVLPEEYESQSEVMRSVAVEVLLTNEYIPGTEDELLLGTLVTTSEGMEIVDNRHVNLLRVLSSYGYWESAPAAAVELSSVSSFCLDAERAQSIVIVGNPYDIDKKTPACRRRRYAVVSMRWPVPEQATIDAFGGAIYYKAILSPINAPSGFSYPVGELYADVLAASFEETLVYRSGDDVGSFLTLNLHVPEGLLYSCRVYQVNGRLNHVISAEPTPAYIVAGVPSMARLSEALGMLQLDCEPYTPSGRIIKITPMVSADDVDQAFLQLFAVELDAVSAMPPDFMAEQLDGRYLFYEGPIQTAWYVASLLHDNVAIKGRIVGRGQRVLAESEPYPIEFASESAQDCVPLVYMGCMTDVAGSTSEEIASFTMPFAFVIKKIICSSYRGYDDPLLAQAILYVTNGSVSMNIPVTLEWDGQGTGSDATIYEADQEVTIRLDSTTADTLTPDGLVVILYIQPKYDMVKNAAPTGSNGSVAPGYEAPI